MKKLICALVLLAMLVPVAAMAEDKLPNSLTADEMQAKQVTLDGITDPINLQVDVQGYKARYKLDLPGDNVTYTAYYYLTGALESSMIIYNHQGGPACVAEFGPTGVAEMIDHICDTPHDFTAPAKVDKLASGETANMPEENVSIVADAYEWDGDDFLTAIKDAYDEAPARFEGNGIAPIDNSPFSVSYMNGQKMLVHFGPIAYGKGKESEVNLRVFGDTNKNILFWANYSTSDGSLKEYGMFSEDGRTLTVYDDKNRLQSTEFWTDDGAYWWYSDEGWYYSANGDPDGGDFGATPSADVLKMITVAPRTAIFTLDNSAGTPMVSNGVAAMTAVTMKDSQTTEFDMSTIGTENLTQPITLVLPYGPGQNQALAEGFTYTVEHKPDGKPAENYSTDPTSASQIKMAFTPDGIQLSNVKSFSPFTVTWGPEQASTVGMDSLPSTGDNSNLLAYACLLLASAAALVMLSKRRAHQ